VIAILGAGQMGEALMSGLLRAGVVSPAGVIAAVRRSERAEELRKAYGVEVFTAAEAARSAETLVITVKPQDMAALLNEIKADVTPEKLVIAHAAEPHLRRAEELLRPVGRVLRIPESQQDAATALSGSGPAYVYFLVEAMVDAGILLGMPRSTALEMVKQAVFGAATMLRDSGEHPVILREAVTSPGGTTINAIRELEKHRVRAAFLAAIEAARDRGRELGGG